MKKNVKTSQYYVWFMGTKEAKGIRGEEFIRPIVEQFLSDNNDDISKVTLQISEKGMKIIQVVPKKSKKNKTENIKYFIPDHCITCVYHSPPPHDDVVSCILLIYNPETECPVHVHSYRCDSVETASLLADHLQQLINKPENQQKFEILESKLISQGLLPKHRGPVDGRSTGTGGSSPSSSEGYEVEGTQYPTRDHVFMPNDRMASLMDSLSKELNQKLKSREMQPILLPPKDYDTWRRCHGDVREAENRKSLQINIVGPNAVYIPPQQETVENVQRLATIHERQSSGLGSSLPESPPRQRNERSRTYPDHPKAYHFGMADMTVDERDSGHHSDDENRPFIADDGFMYTKPVVEKRPKVRVVNMDSDGIRVRPYVSREPPSPSKSNDSGLPRNDNSLRQDRERERERKWQEMADKLDETGVFKVKDANKPSEVFANRTPSGRDYVPHSSHKKPTHVSPTQNSTPPRHPDPQHEGFRRRETMSSYDRTRQREAKPHREKSPLRRVHSQMSPSRQHREAMQTSPQRFEHERNAAYSYSQESSRASPYNQDFTRSSPYNQEPSKKHETEVSRRASQDPNLSRSLYHVDSRQNYERQEHKPGFGPEPVSTLPHEPQRWSPYAAEPPRQHRVVDSPRRSPYDGDHMRRGYPQHRDPYDHMPPSRDVQHSPYEPVQPRETIPKRSLFDEPTHQRAPHVEPVGVASTRESPALQKYPYSDGRLRNESPAIFRSRGFSLHERPIPEHSPTRLRRHESDVSRFKRKDDITPSLQRHQHEQLAQSTPTFAFASPRDEHPRGRGRERMPPLTEGIPAAMPPVGFTNQEFDEVVIRKRSQHSGDRFPERYGSLDRRSPSPPRHPHIHSQPPTDHYRSQPVLNRESPRTSDIPKNYQGMYHPPPRPDSWQPPSDLRPRNDVRRSQSFQVGPHRPPIVVHARR